MGTGTWTQADWKCELKNKVKRETTTHQTHCRGRQAGAATTGVARHGWVQVSRCKHRQVRAWGHGCRQVVNMNIKKEEKKQKKTEEQAGRGAARQVGTSRKRRVNTASHVDRLVCFQTQTRPAPAHGCV